MQEVSALQNCVVRARTAAFAGGAAVAILGFDEVFNGYLTKLGIPTNQMRQIHHALAGIVTDWIFNTSIVLPTSRAGVLDNACSGFTGFAGGWVGPKLKNITPVIKDL